MKRKNDKKERLWRIRIKKWSKQNQVKKINSEEKIILSAKNISKILESLNFSDDVVFANILIQEIRYERR